MSYAQQRSRPKPSLAVANLHASPMHPTCALHAEHGRRRAEQRLLAAPRHPHVGGRRGAGVGAGGSHGGVELGHHAPAALLYQGVCSGMHCRILKGALSVIVTCLEPARCLCHAMLPATPSVMPPSPQDEPGMGAQRLRSMMAPPPTYTHLPRRTSRAWAPSGFAA